MSRAVRLASFVTVSIACAGIGLARHPKIAEDLRVSDPAANTNVIVQFRQAPSAAHHRRVANRGGRLQRVIDVVNGGAYSIPASALEDLANDPDVVSISPDHEIRATASQYAAPMQAINAPMAWRAGFDGTGIGVAVIDSGINTHNDLTPRVVYRQNFATDTVSSTGPYDLYGHGTHVAGIIAGSGLSSDEKKSIYTFSGVAPNANLIDLRVLDQNGASTDSIVIAAIQRAIQLKSQYNIRVINLSVGRRVTAHYMADPLCQAVESAWKAGIVVVVAAGNFGRDNSFGNAGYGTIAVPGNDPYVITVGAMKDMGTPGRGDDLIASYSSKGPTLLDHIVKPDLVAPGNLYISLGTAAATLRVNYPGNVINPSYYTNHLEGTADPQGYFKLSGTSMATPVVSGTVALLLQKQPGLTPDVVKARLMKTATKNFPASSIATDPTTGQTFVSKYDIFTIGAGYLDANAALNNSDTTTLSAMSPAVVYDSKTGKASLSVGQAVLWGSSVIWGDSVIWGTTVLINGSSVIWGDSVCWGDSTSQAFSVIWGDSVPSATSVSSGTSTPSGLSVLVQGEN